MAFDQSTRNRLQKFVSDARGLLSEEFTRQLQNDYGLDPHSGTITPVESLGHLDDTRRETARILRDTLAHYLASSPSGGAREALDRIVREQAFTVLNRLAALRMAESRGILIESVGSGYQSKGFQLYERLAGPGLGETGDTYRCYLFSIFDEFALDLKVLFDRFSPQGRLFPRATALLDLLKLLNDPELAHLWAEDESIGWVYQYFNSKEERKKMRDESAAPRNSRELAVRNQFFTPRYVVEFLTDNTLGRIWYEMTQGETCLKESCRYLVRRPNEFFLKPGEKAPEKPDSDENLSQEDLLKQPVYIQTRLLKDPRTLRMLDPACGSMHFGLYAFDLYEQIYDEAWELELRLGSKAFVREDELIPITESYSDKGAFLRDVPRLIIEHNIHGIDIDPRAAQIAGLSLWLRAQRSWHNQGVKPVDRPRIIRSNIVCAEPMPGEKELLREFTSRLELPALGYLVEQVFDKMQLAGEAGSLLMIEEEIRDIIAEAKRLWKAGPKLTQMGLFGEAPAKPEQIDLPLDFSGITDERFWESAEDKLYQALQDYAEAAGEHGYQRRLFAEDSARGFAFIDLCRKRYDAIVMNPPFGEASDDLLAYLLENYEAFNRNLLCAFVARTLGLGNEQASIGAIYDRTAIVKSTYEEFRLTHLLCGDRLHSQCDLGWEVLDANVETTASVIRVSPPPVADAVFIDVRSLKPDMKGSASLEALRAYSMGITNDKLVVARGSTFRKFPNAVVGYDFPEHARRSFFNMRSISSQSVTLYEGHTLKAEVFFRYWWEVPLSEAFIPDAPWQRLYNGGDYQRFVSPLCDACLYGSNGSLTAAHSSTILRNLPLQQQGKLGFGKRGEFMDAHVVPPGFVSTVEGKHVNIGNIYDPFAILALFNSQLFQSIINLYCGQHKYPGYVGIFPAPELDSSNYLNIAATLCKKIYIILRSFETMDEISPLFFGANTKALFDRTIHQHASSAIKTVSVLEDQMNDAVAQAYDLSSTERVIVSEQCARIPDIGGWASRATSYEVFSLIISYIIGTAFGRWNIFYATGEFQSSDLPDPFDPLPVCPPGMLQNAEGLPAKQKDVPEDYPLRISWSGILVDDENHREDIAVRVNEVIEIIWKEKAGDIEHEACEILGVHLLRDYFTKSSGFFADHLKRYSKSHRQAPIYWPLSTPSGSYTLWLYYHRLTDQTLYTCVMEYIEPKLRDVAAELTNLRQKGSGRNRDDEKKLEKLQDFETDLQEFRDELLRLARLPWKPNLNDGVQITAAPLWKLFQLPKWKKTLKETWEKLEKGEYDWAHLAYSIWPDRVKKKCVTDKSLAIAHDLEDLYVEPPASAKKKRGKKAAVIEDEEE